MKFQTLGKAGPNPEALKRKVKRAESEVYIKTPNGVYKAKWSALRNLALNHYEAVEKLSAELGMDDVSFMSRACHICNFNAQSVMNYFFGDGKEPDLGSSNCNYPGKLGIKVAEVLQERKTGRRFYAETNPCPIEEAMVAHLEKTGQLDQYQVTEEYRFKPLMSFEKGESKPGDFIAPRIPLTSRLLDFLKI